MANWQYDPDFGWYDADDVLGNVPTGPTVIPGTDVYRDIGGEYHPDVDMPDPVITMENIARGFGDVGTTTDTNIFLAALNEILTGGDSNGDVEVGGDGTSTGPQIGDTTPDGEQVYTSEGWKMINPPSTALDQQEQQEQAWIQLYGEPGGVTTLNDLNYQELKALVAKPGFVSLYPEAQRMLDARIGRGYSRNPNVRDVPYTDMTPGTYNYLVTKFIQTGTGTGGVPGFGATQTGGRPSSTSAQLQGFFNEVKAYLQVAGHDTSDQNVYNTMVGVAGDASDAGEQIWYSRNFDAWRGGTGKDTPPPSATDVPKEGDISADGQSRWVNGTWQPITGGNGDTGTDDGPPSSGGGAPVGFSIDQWNSLTDDKQKEYLSLLGAGAETFGTAVPATEGILAGITPQETFPQDVFRRFLAEQQGAPLSPFMQRGAQNLYPQLSAEYSFLPYMPGVESPALPTFASFLQQGQRPSRGQMLGTLGDIGSVLSQGPAGTLAEGISPAEMLRRGRIQSAFGTESPESRQRLQSMLSGAFMSGIAPAFRYPVQAGVQNVFETQRALQPDKPFLSFLGERL